MKLIGKSSCIVTLRGFSGNNTLAVSNTMLSSVYVTPSPGLVTLDFLIISCSSWSWPCKCQPRDPASHPDGGLVHFYLKWVETLTVMELVTVFKSSCGPDLHWAETREKGKNLDTRPRDSPPRGQCSEFHDGRITQKLSQYDIAYYWLHCHGDWKTSTHREKTDYLIHCIIRVILWVSLKVDARLMNLKLMRAQFRTQQESVFVNFIFWLGAGKQASQLRIMQVLKTNWKLFRMSNIQQALFYLF